MTSSVNKIRNPDFSRGKERPLAWAWESDLRGATWTRPSSAGPRSAGVTITLDAAPRRGAARFSQIVVCKPAAFYRVEATVQCDLAVTFDRQPVVPEADVATEAAHDAGFVVAVEPVDPASGTGRTRRRARTPLHQRRGQQPDAPPRGPGLSPRDLPQGTSEAWGPPAGPPDCARRRTPGVHRASAPFCIRAYYEAPKGVRRLRLSVGLVDAAGVAHIHEVRFVPILAPEEESHPMAVPPPSHALRTPRPVRRVCICSASAAQRGLTDVLRLWFSEANVQPAAPESFDTQAVDADAVLFPDPTLPRSVRSIAALEALSQERIVVVSLPAFASLAPRSLRVRRVEQDDDPIHAKIAYGNYATRGFALHDAFPYAWRGKQPGSFVQNHYGPAARTRKTNALNRFCRKHGLRPLLLSLCNRDVTSDRPASLFRQTDRGALFVLDLDPVEVESSSFGEPGLAAQLLLNVLGQTHHGLGQFSSPVRKESELREMIRELGVRLEALIVRDGHVPIEEVTEQVVSVGGEDASFGLQIAPRPVMVIRSGVRSGDVESFFAVLQWVKQLVRPDPYPCAYARPLIGRFRLRWVPFAARWESRDGWRRGGLAPARAQPGAIEGPVRAVIDLVSRPVNRFRAVFPRSDATYQRHEIWLPRLMESFGAQRFVGFEAAEDDPFTDRDRYSWRVLRPRVQVAAEADTFGDDLHRQVLADGGDVVRIEIPGCDADFAAGSMYRTNVSATLLEHVVGLQYGAIAVNRRSATVNFDGYGTVSPGQAMILDRNDPLLQSAAAQTG